MKPRLVCLTRRHKWRQGWDNERRLTVWNCDRCRARRVRIGELDPRKSGWGDM
jgi:hypothetical protein